jgi:hypothetical protein
LHLVDYRPRAIAPRESAAQRAGFNAARDCNTRGQTNAKRYFQRSFEFLFASLANALGAILTSPPKVFSFKGIANRKRI